MYEYTVTVVREDGTDFTGRFKHYEAAWLVLERHARLGRCCRMVKQFISLN